MFETYEPARAGVPIPLTEPGVSLWDYAFTRLNVHWFYVVCRSSQDDDGYRAVRNFFLGHAEHVHMLNQSPDWEILEVQIISPAHINSTGHWDMDLVSEILRGTENTVEFDQHGYVFVLAAGGRYVISLTNREADLADLEQLYAQATSRDQSN